MARIRKEIGPYSVGEIPQPLQISFVDHDGEAIDLAGYQADFVIERADDAIATDAGGGAGTIPTPASGITQYAFVAADFATAGRYRGQMWVGNGSLRFASIEYWWDVVAITTAPAI